MFWSQTEKPISDLVDVKINKLINVNCCNLVRLMMMTKYSLYQGGQVLGCPIWSLMENCFGESMIQFKNGKIVKIFCQVIQITDWIRNTCSKVIQKRLKCNILDLYIGLEIKLKSRQ